jgi:hypothetical protein
MEVQMFFVRGNNQLWCLSCAMARFLGTGKEDETPENIEAFIVNVRHGWEADQQGGVLEEVVNAQHLAEARCSRCTTPLAQLFSVNITPLFQSAKSFVPSYALPELTEYRFAQAAGEAVQPPFPEWVPSPERPAFVTDLDPAQWDRRNYIPFQAVPTLVRDMRILVSDEKGLYHGALVYVTANNIALIQLDEKRPSQREAPLVDYPVDYLGLYIDSEGCAHYQTICGLRDVHAFQFTFTLLSAEERQAQEPAPYTWKFTIVDPDQRTIPGVANTFREAIENVYLTLCLRGYIDDPAIEMPVDVGEPF